MNKILLYEPGDRGHRPVILNYVIESLRQSGIDYDVVTDPLLNISALHKIARERKCSGLHYLTVDGVIKDWLWDWVPFRERVPALGTYYLFSNAYRPVKSIALRVACLAAGLRALLISDDEILVRRKSPCGAVLSYLPDPWMRKEFPFLTKHEARRRLKLDDRSCLYLMIGELSSRKGCDLFIEALGRLSPGRDIQGILAGRIDNQLSLSHKAICDQLFREGLLKIFPGFVAEEDMSVFFHAADYIVCPYPAIFQVSSNTATRAMAAGRPYLTFNHGSIAATARRHGCGRSPRSAAAASSVPASPTA